VDFKRLALQPGESRRLRFTLTPEMMSMIDLDGKPVQLAGQYRVEIGGCSPGGRGLELDAPEPVRAEFIVR
jgi:beta-glucosidase